MLVDGSCHIGEVRRSAIHVDVDAVRGTGDERHIGSESGKQMRCDRGRGAVGAIDDDATSCEIGAGYLGNPL